MEVRRRPSPKELQAARREEKRLTHSNEAAPDAIPHPIKKAPAAVLANGEKASMGDISTVIFCVLMIFAVIWAFTGMWPWEGNSYNSYALQAQSWLEGRLDLGQNYQHLELAVYSGKYFVSFPPLPSVVLLPFVMVSQWLLPGDGLFTPDHLINVIVVIIGAVYALKTANLFGKKGASAIFWTLFLTCASTFLHISTNGWVWFMAQAFSFTLSMMAVYYAATPRLSDGRWPLLLWALAVGCRPFQIIFLPVILYLFYKKCAANMDTHSIIEILRRKWRWLIAPVAVAVVYMLLNYFRFDSPFEFGHNYLPEFTQEQYGQFSFEYFKDNIGDLLFALPVAGEYSKLEFDIYGRMAFWLASPIFISYFVYMVTSFKNKKRDLFYSLGILILTMVHFIATASHRTLGGWQFGCRYTADVLPFIFLAVMYFTRDNEKTDKFNYPLFCLGLCLNVVGSIAVYNYWI